MIKSLKMAAVLAAVTLTCGGAQAVNVDWGPHDVVELAVGTPGPGVFLDTYTFSLSAPVDLLLNVAVSANDGTARVITDSGYMLFSDGADATPFTADDTPLAAYVFDGTTGATPHAALLGVGNYYYLVGGNAAGTDGGAYLLVSVAIPLPVPEPSTWALFFGGLGAIGAVVRRRRPG